MTEQEQGDLRAVAERFYGAIERGDREGVAALTAPSFRVEGFIDGVWQVWDRNTYLSRVTRFKELFGVVPKATLRSIRGDGEHAIVDGSLRWDTGGFADTLVFARRDGEWLLQHKTFRSLSPCNEGVDLYTATGPNGYKVAIALEELGIPYEVHSVDLSAGEQFKEPLASLNPNHKVPALVDRDTGHVMFESNAILLHLAERSGQLLPASTEGRSEAVQWLFFQAASLGPMLGQRGHFEAIAEEKLPYAIERYRKETERLFDVLETRLQSRDYLLGDYSVVDISCFAWLYCVRAFGFRFEPQRPALKQWFHGIMDRPAVQRGLKVPAPFGLPQPDA